MRAWVWLLPCWIWRWYFHYMGKMLIDIGGKKRAAVRLDNEYILVRSPTKSWLEKRGIYGDE